MTIFFKPLVLPSAWGADVFESHMGHFRWNFIFVIIVVTVLLLLLSYFILTRLLKKMWSITEKIEWLRNHFVQRKPPGKVLTICCVLNVAKKREEKRSRKLKKERSKLLAIIPLLPWPSLPDTSGEIANREFKLCSIFLFIWLKFFNYSVLFYT
ncbi:unnamed protein product [Acanthoscelides obtectus]|uniref:Uncharacterized protein n=1 Tax=Acanthoscelides obtectus TaxID=200917 RepID=A0A9P0PQ90_ACAOB|nr:unnamed protein product [Acanthoscelides obtectus]CAK1626065.1 hypothetical protein AOBTE_LOCUS3578 [Acanthoscelides obtectus]